jgi:hypothetical protein
MATKDERKIIQTIRADATEMGGTAQKFGPGDEDALQEHVDAMNEEEAGSGDAELERLSTKGLISGFGYDTSDRPASDKPTVRGKEGAAASEKPKRGKKAAAAATE